MRRLTAIALAPLLALPAVAQDRTGQDDEEEVLIGSGVASYYGQELAGNRTASGERFDVDALTAAHRTLPFGTLLRVRSVDTGREVVVRVNDRGPAKRERAVDLSRGAARALGVDHLGVFRVQIWRE